MDISKLVTNIKGIDDYVSFTQNLAHKYKELKFQFNMSTVLSLKNLRSLEIEYFNKCDDNGAAFLIFERMQSLPPSKTWNLLGKEAVSLIQYWLDAVRKHLISHHPHWWAFLKHLLGFIKNIRHKDPALIKMLVSETAESLLDLATNNRMTSIQRYEVLHTFNLFCAESSREIRLALRPQFEHYFIKLAAIMASCGYVPTQYAITEALLRWMQPRKDPDARKTAAANWFPEDLYPRKTVQLFLERRWFNFCQDARDFLNSFNENGDLVMSVVCKKMSIGKVVLLSGAEHSQIWLDINSLERCLSVLLEPRMLQAVDAGRASCSTLVISCDNTVAAEFYRESLEFIINLRTVDPPQLVPCDLNMFNEEDTNVSIILSSNTNMLRLSNALRDVFKDKYQVLLDFDNMPALTSPLPDGSRRFTNKDEARFSQPETETRRRKHSGYIVRPGNRAWKSPSSVSTSSLAQLQDKLTAYLPPKQNREREPVCAQPELLSVEELSETDDILSVQTKSTLKLVPPTKTYKGKKSLSDTEATKRSIGTTEFNRSTKTKSEINFKRQAKTDCVVQDKCSNSCLFLATISTTDQSVIDETLERLPNDENIIDSLVKEALNANKNDRIDSGIDEGKKTQDFGSIEAIENTPYVEPGKVRPAKEKVGRTVVSKTTSDESNTEAISDTQINYVSVRKKHFQRKKFTLQNNEQEVENFCPKDQATYESNEAVEDFFSRHFSENQARDVVVCPTLAKRNNETSSENSEDLDKYLVSNNFNVNEDDLHDVEILDCLNSIVDQVCNEFDACTELLNRQTERGMLNVVNYISAENMPLKETSNTIKEAHHNQSIKMETRSKQKAVKLTYKKTAPKKSKAKVNSKKKLLLEPTKMTPIIEATDESVLKNSSAITKTNEETPLTRRKRKLYSPKNDQMMQERSEHDEEFIKKAAELSSHEEDVALSEFKKRSNSITPKSTATCYREIEKDRQKNKLNHIRKLKNKAESPVSPKTKKLNDVFDQLKDTVVSNEKITLADKNKKKDFDVYNFTSDSEDEKFQKKKMVARNRTSTTTIDSGNSMLPLRRGRNIRKNYTEKDTKSDDNKTSERKKVVRRKNTRSKPKVDILRDVMDEKMRKASSDVLNTSMVIEKPADDFNKEPDPIIIPPEIEKIEEQSDVIKKKPTKKEDKNLTKKEKAKALRVLEDEAEGTISPLPGLVVETVHTEVHKEECPPEKMVKKFQKIYQQGPESCINETTTTHTLLSDMERTNISNFNAIEDIDEIQNVLNDSRCEQNYDKNVTKRANTRVLNNLEINCFKEKDIGTDKVTKRNPKLKNKAKSESDKVNFLIETNEKPYNSKRANTVISGMKAIYYPESIIENKNADIDKIKESKKPKTKETATQSDKNDYQTEKNETYNTSKIVRQLDKKTLSIDKKIATNKSKKTCANESTVPKKQKLLRTINLTLSDSISERSIATLGITGHGDSSQTPPSTKNLAEKITIPRELEDLDQSIQNYYIKLRTEVNMKEQTVTNNSKSSVSSKDTENKVKSPIVLLKRISNKELSKFQSRDCSNLSGNERSCKKLSDKELMRCLQSSNDSVSEVYESAKDSTDKPVFKRMSYDISKWLPSQSDCDIKSNDSQASKTVIKKSRNDISEKDPNKRRSLISPIKLFDDVLLSKSQQKQNAIKTTTVKNSTPKSKSPEKQEEKTHFLSKRRTETKINKNTLENKESSTDLDTSKSSPECSRIARTVKRRSVKETIDVIKKRKLEDNGSEFVAETGPSLSSVDDWFRKNGPTRSREDNVDFSIRDAMQNVMEKLDVTLEEIHQNTDKSLLHLFVDAQKQLSDMKEERRELKRRTVANVRALMKSVDEQLAELDRRWIEMDVKFMVDLQRRASGLLREDCKRKRALVAILKEDVQAVSDHLDRLNK